MAEEKKWYYLIARKELETLTGSAGVDAILDMLRYDDSRVESNSPEGFWLFSSPHAPCLPRWRSFLVKVQAVTKKAHRSFPGYDEVSCPHFWDVLY